jgi:hypothetical protein
MKTMSDTTTNTGEGITGFVLMAISWVCGYISLSVTSIPIILSSIASALVIVNQIIQFRKNKK